MKCPNQYRLRTGQFASDETDGNNGVFIIPLGNKLIAQVMASDGYDWDHVSVTIQYKGKNIMPTWDQMCLIKDMFWDESEAVFQIHPPKSEYVNNHPYCLHMWRPQKQVIELPNSILVGLK